jgi:glycine/D-amino acid oxidase-like deaminating enzyme
MERRPDHDAIVIGGGFFGCSLALALRRELGARTLVLEAGPALMERASFVNQARVHNGYHYPRSILTGLRSRVNFPRFTREFEACVVRDFRSYYAIARRFSKVSAGQFRLFCQRIGAPLQPAPAAVRRLFAADAVEDVFEVQEFAFDAAALRRLVAEKLEEHGVELRLATEAAGLRALAGPEPGLAVVTADGEELAARRVFNCTYSRINRLLHAARLPALPLKHELTEIALVEPPDELRPLAVTVMCGPFFSLMPFPARGLHSLSHVRYTPHAFWHERPGEPPEDPYQRLAAAPRRSHFVRMLRDARRYLPALAGCRHVDSLWEVKTVLPSAERDDGRPILFAGHPECPNLVSVMGGKIDNIYDVLEVEARERDRRVA